MEDIAAYVRDEYSQHGVEVGSRGEKSLTLKLPPELPCLTNLVAELWNTFGATVALKHSNAPNGASLTVFWNPAHHRPPTPENVRVGPGMWVAPVATICGLMLAAVVPVVVMGANASSWLHL
jgi:hypothetical protein